MDQKRKNEIEIPDEFLNMLKENKAAYKIFNQLSPSHIKEYINWINEAKKDATKINRMIKAVDLIMGKEVN